MSEQALAETVLLVEDDAPFRAALGEVLAAQGYAVLPAANGVEALRLLQEHDVDAVVTDLVMPGMRGDALLDEVRSAFPGVPVIAMTAFGSIEEAVELTRAGAAEYVTKPFRTRALLDPLRRALDASRPGREQRRRRREFHEHFDGIIGASRPMLRLFRRIGRVAGSAAPVLISGDTGTGKELVARAVHQASGRDPFVAVNCGAMPRNLLESELFGHVKGAFTGADRTRQGLLEAAAGGTLFLDEVAELPLELQPALLRAIESGEVRAVGDVVMKHVDVRIVAATHRDLEEAVRTGRFREDLYWRLNVLTLTVPPLRERAADIPLLVEEFLGAIGARHGRQLAVTPAALALLVGHSWPGNVRQLLNVLERAATFADAEEIDVPDLPAELREAGRNAALIHASADRNATLAEVEREYILEVLRRAGGNKSRAAELLGIPRRTLYRRLAAYDGRDL